MKRKKLRVQKCETDDKLLPIPTQIVSNEEFALIDQTDEQKRVEHRLIEIANDGDHAAEILRVSDRSDDSGVRRRPRSWRTDSIWWGSPQWQIEAFRRLQMPEDLMKRFKFKPLTDKVKEKILGLNSAKVYCIDVKAKMNTIPSD